MCCRFLSDVVDPEHMVCVRLDDEVAMVDIIDSAADEASTPSSSSIKTTSLVVSETC